MASNQIQDFHDAQDVQEAARKLEEINKSYDRAGVNRPDPKNV